MYILGNLVSPVQASSQKASCTTRGQAYRESGERLEMQSLGARPEQAPRRADHRGRRLPQLDPFPWCRRGGERSQALCTVSTPVPQIRTGMPSPHCAQGSVWPGVKPGPPAGWPKVSASGAQGCSLRAQPAPGHSLALPAWALPVQRAWEPFQAPGAHRITVMMMRARRVRSEAIPGR